MKPYILFGLLLANAAQATTSSEHHETQHQVIPTTPDVTVISHALSMHSEPKYAATFTHFAYTNPDAPKGGSIKLSASGTFDNFNRYASRGVAAQRSGELYDALFVGSMDELGVYYPLIATQAEYSENWDWIAVDFHPDARFHDGEAITAYDFAFSFQKFWDEGVPQFKSYYADVKVSALNEHRVVITLEKPDKEKLFGILTLPVLPQHFWHDKDFSQPLNTPPVGSGAYQIADYKMGQQVTYQRVADYWAVDLPVNKGLYNFDTLVYDYYRDNNVSLEAFKAGEYDFRTESSAKNWATLYSGPAFSRGDIVTETIPHSIPQGMSALVFNTHREIFTDPKVREALAYAFDFEWMNKALFFGLYSRNRSYFQSSPYEAEGLPSDSELTYLEPLREQIPPRVFTESYLPPITDGNGLVRNNLLVAKHLLEEAGWHIVDQQLINKVTGKPFVFELMLYSPDQERTALPLQANLKRLGITMNIRLVDSSQFINRMRSRDYDMIDRGYSANQYPSGNLMIAWHSQFIDSTYNAAGVTDPAIDHLTEVIAQSQGNADALAALGPALDRVLTWNFYVIPKWHLNAFWVAYWDKFDRPATRPDYALGLDTWWSTEGSVN
uniref:extracellular solute-binding protein n=1 Tax=Thaumasiovibrio occultus TaxID=1891184 RepID=UPI000B35EED6|nr:extracellular solute-binding protein [Thaumasiovibrio occultus]